MNSDMWWNNPQILHQILSQGSTPAELDSLYEMVLIHILEWENASYDHKTKWIRQARELTYDIHKNFKTSDKKSPFFHTRVE